MAPHNALPPGVVQGPDGKFQSASEVAARFEDLEYLTGETVITVNSADSTVDDHSAASYEGVTLLDVDDITDRHEVAHLLLANLRLVLQSEGSTSTGRQEVHVAVEVSASPSRSATIEMTGDETSIGDQTELQAGISDVQFKQEDTDDADLIARPLRAYKGYAFEDETNGPGGPGSSDMDTAVGPPPGTWDFDRRDELFLNGIFQMHGDASANAHAMLGYQLVFGVTED